MFCFSITSVSCHSPDVFLTFTLIHEMSSQLSPFSNKSRSEQRTRLRTCGSLRKHKIRLRWSVVVVCRLESCVGTRQLQTYASAMSKFTRRCGVSLYSEILCGAHPKCVSGRGVSREFSFFGGFTYPQVQKKATHRCDYAILLNVLRHWDLTEFFHFRRCILGDWRSFAASSVLSEM